MTWLQAILKVTPCQHCEQAAAATTLNLCKACDDKPQIRRLYLYALRHQSPEKEARIRKLRQIYNTT